MGFFRDFKEDLLSEEQNGSKTEDREENTTNEHEEDIKMSDFEDANVDKELLSQIFSSDSAAPKDDLFADSSSEEQPEQEEYQQAELADILSDNDVEEEEPELTVEDILKAAREEYESGQKEEDVKGSVPEAEEAATQEEKTEKPVEKEETVVEMAEEKKPEEKPVAVQAAQLDDMTDSDITVITKGTTINGGISSDGSLEIMGTITGDVDCKGKLSVYGQISGNVKAADVVVKTKRLEGNIDSVGLVEIAAGTIVVGDINGTSATINGAVKGNIDVNGPVVVDSTAIVQGSIKAKSIQVNTGAVVDGYCSLNYAGVNLDDFFAS